MTVTLCFSQSSGLLMDFQNDKEIQGDSWSYETRYDGVRYDLPKWRVQVLEFKARNYTTVDSLYREVQTTLDTLVGKNVNLLEQVNTLQTKTLLLRDRTDDLIEFNNQVVDKFNNVVEMNERLNDDLDKSREKFKRVRSQRNWALVGLTVLAGAVILTSS